MYQTLGILAGIALAFYAFFLLGRLGHYYADRFPWQFARKYTLGLKLLLAIAAGIVCLDIWSAAAMVALHLAAFFILTDVMNLLMRRLSRKSSPKWQHLYGSGVLPMVLLACVMFYGSINMNQVVQTDYTITTQKAIRAEGYRVAFLSDIHYGTVQDKAVLRSCIKKINAQKPDIVVLGGDIVEEGTSLQDMQEVFYHLGCLDAPMGIYFVYGNHDRQADSNSRTYTDEELIAAIEDNGIVILEDKTQLVGGELLLIGRADAAWDTNAARKEIGEVLLPEQEGLFLLTLDHQPLEAAENAAAGVDLKLSGHTHAGQLFPVGYLTDWIGGMNYGLYQTGNCQSIVSSGFAGWGYGIRTQGHCEYVIVDILPSPLQANAHPLFEDKP